MQAADSTIRPEVPDQLSVCLSLRLCNISALYQGDNCRDQCHKLVTKSCVRLRGEAGAWPVLAQLGLLEAPQSGFLGRSSPNGSSLLGNTFGGRRVRVGS